MSTIATTAAINIDQLSRELGDIGFRFEFDGVTSTITADVDEATLRAVVDAHEPAPPAPTPERLLQQQLDELTDLTMELLMGT